MAITASVPPAQVGSRRPNGDLFVVSVHKVRDRSGAPPLAWVPYGLEHAWRPGSRQTLCGQWTSGWNVFWELPFSAQHGAPCRACVEASLPAESRRRLAPVPDPGRQSA
jgi:hypothetical protein